MRSIHSALSVVDGPGFYIVVSVILSKSQRHPNPQGSPWHYTAELTSIATTPIKCFILSRPELVYCHNHTKKWFMSLSSLLYYFHNPIVITIYVQFRSPKTSNNFHAGEKSNYLREKTYHNRRSHPQLHFPDVPIRIQCLFCDIVIIHLNPQVTLMDKVSCHQNFMIILTGVWSNPPTMNNNNKNTHNKKTIENNGRIIITITVILLSIEK